MSPKIESILNECPEWFHAIELGPGLITPGVKTPEILDRELQLMRLPDLQGRSVLDIGAYDGFFSFAAERMGASRVVALDHYVWSTNMADYMSDWRARKQTGESLPPPHQSPHWDPVGLPGRKPFDLARRMLNSRVEPIVGDFMKVDPAELGTFDVVFFLGVLYHMENPLAALQRLRALTAPGGIAIIETEAMEIPGAKDRAFCEFFPERELNNDPSNWWAPNAKAIEGLCRAAGFSSVEVTPDRALPLIPKPGHHWTIGLFGSSGESARGLPVLRYRAWAHAFA